MNAEKISALVITLNEIRHIETCLKSVSWADEMVVVDAGSTDGTVEAARRLGAVIFHRDWQGYVSQRRFALERASNDWVLFLDADETVTEALKNDIRKRLGKESCSGYRINRLNHFTGKPVLHCGWHPDWVLRCFNRRFADFPDVRIHEGIRVEGGVSELNGMLLHHSYDSIQDYILKMNRYTSLEVEDKLQRLSDKPIRWHDWILHPFSRFHRMFVVKKGYQDGKIGLLVSLLSSLYLFVLYAKMWEHQNGKTE